MCIRDRAPADGASIAVQITQKDGIEANYRFNPGANTEILAVTDANTGRNIGYSFNNQTISIASYELVENREIAIEYQVPSLHEGNNLLTLAHLPLEPTVRVESNGVRCTNFDVQGNMIDISDCGFSANQTTIEVTYKYLDIGLVDTFVFSKSLPVSLDNVEWTVFVNQVETNQYTRSNLSLIHI